MKKLPKKCDFEATHKAQKEKQKQKHVCVRASFSHKKIEKIAKKKCNFWGKYEAQKQKRKTK